MNFIQQYNDIISQILTENNKNFDKQLFNSFGKQLKYKFEYLPIFDEINLEYIKLNILESNILNDIEHDLLKSNQQKNVKYVSDLGIEFILIYDELNDIERLNLALTTHDYELFTNYLGIIDKSLLNLRFIKYNVPKYKVSMVVNLNTVNLNNLNSLLIYNSIYALICKTYNYQFSDIIFNFGYITINKEFCDVRSDENIDKYKFVFIKDDVKSISDISTHNTTIEKLC